MRRSIPIRGGGEVFLLALDAGAFIKNITLALRGVAFLLA
jgi:hypothetical protein